MRLCWGQGVSENPVTQADVHLRDALCISSHAFPFDLLLLLSHLQDVVNKGFHIVDSLTFLVEIVNTFYDYLQPFKLSYQIYTTVG